MAPRIEAADHTKAVKLEGRFARATYSEVKNKDKLPTKIPK